MQQFLQKYNLKLTSSQIEQFGKFLTLFIEYNSHTNLSAIRDEQGVIEKHFIDSLMLSKFEDLHGRLLDIGSGGGFPGIPLKILLPELEVTLLDSVGKKVNAMNYFIRELGLDENVIARSIATGQSKKNDFLIDSLDSSFHSEGRAGVFQWPRIIAIKERAEVLAKDSKFAMQFDIITSRATAYMPQILEWARPFLRPNGKIILYKLDNPEELHDGQEAMRKMNLRLQSVHRYEIGGQERIFVVIGRK